MHQESQRARGVFPLRGLVAICLLVLVAVSGVAQAQEGPWTGRWHSYWRDGAALVSLQQTGAVVTGSYMPGEGRIEGRVRGGVLSGRWFEGEAEGRFIFALADDGESFTGRFESGEFWNGHRIPAGAPDPGIAVTADSPRAALTAYVQGGNAAIHGGNVAAMASALAHLDYAGGAEDERERRRRRQALWRLVDLSTFRLYDAPVRVEGDRAAFEIGPDGGRETFALRFRRVGEHWKLVVPEEAELAVIEMRLAGALGHGSVEAALAARQGGPRAAMRDFIQGVHTWDEGGRARALAVLDLSFLPSQLYELEAPVLADYLKRVLDRAGFVHWQEIPDDPDREAPYLHYRHAAGSVVIGRVPGAEGAPDRWVFTAGTMRAAPDLFKAMQALPVAEEVGETEPLTRFFSLRETIRRTAPALLVRRGLLETWQWSMLTLAVGVALAGGWLAGRAVTAGGARLFSGAEGVERQTLSRLDWPLRVSVAGVVGLMAFSWLGLAQTALEGATLVLTTVTTAAIGLLAFRLVDLVGHVLQARAASTPGYVDEILTSLASGALKVGIVVATVMALADAVGLPYEGVIAGLGVGGIAIAFAARDTVSNMLGGAILMSDRPFRRGDLIETDAGWATVETVGLRSTRMRTLDDAVLIIPNAQLTDKSIVNWGRRRRRRVKLTVGLTYDTPRETLDRFVEELREVYAAQPRADATEGYVGLKQFGPSSIDVELIGYFRVLSYEAQVAAQHALIGDIVDLARRIGVSFAFPTRTVIVEGDHDLRGSGGAVSVPPDAPAQANSPAPPAAPAP